MAVLSTISFTPSERKMPSSYLPKTVPLSTAAARGWVHRVSSIFRKEISYHIDQLPPVSVFEVPNALSFQKPEAYTPQLLALGPYHHLRPELYPMERYKLAAIKHISTPDQLFQFQHLVINRLKELDPFTRACYSKFMDYDEDTLAWIVAIDGCFLLHLWDSHLDSDDGTDKALLNNTLITRDIMMLANQIPYILLMEIRKALHLCSSDNEEDPELFRILVEFCKAQSPVKITNVNNRTQSNTRPRHLLDLMYRLILGTNDPDSFISPLEDGRMREVPIYVDFEPSSSSSSSSSFSSSRDHEEQFEARQKNVVTILDLVQSLGNKQTAAILKPVQVIANIPWSSISGLLRKGTLKHGEKSSSDDEIAIPSVWYLWRYAHVQCRPIVGGIGDIRFSEKEATLYLPVLNLNATSEVIFRNLVAYEAAMSKSALEFARYINLMNGIVDTAADVKLLKQNGVISGALTDDEIADLFNGMRRFYVRSDQRSNIDIAIEKVNRYYDQKLVVKMRRQIKKHLSASWRRLAILSTILLFALLCVQSFCQVYTCSRFWTSK